MKVKLLATAVAAGVCGVAIVGCSPGGSVSRAVTSPTAPASPAAKVAPALKSGGTVRVDTTASDLTNSPAGSADVTLIYAREVAELPGSVETERAPGQVYAVLTFKVKDVGSGEFDTYPIGDANWVGRDGYTTPATVGFASVEPGTIVPYQSFSGQDNPRPGQYVLGTDVFVIPKGPGRLVFSDRNESRLFTVPLP